MNGPNKQLRHVNEKKPQTYVKGEGLKKKLAAADPNPLIVHN